MLYDDARSMQPREDVVLRAGSDHPDDHWLSLGLRQCRSFLAASTMALVCLNELDVTRTVW